MLLICFFFFLRNSSSSTDTYDHVLLYYVPTVIIYIHLYLYICTNMLLLRKYQVPLPINYNTSSASSYHYANSKPKDGTVDVGIYIIYNIIFLIKTSMNIIVRYKIIHRYFHHPFLLQTIIISFKRHMFRVNLGRTPICSRYS